MADDLTRRGGPDRGRINIEQEHEVRDWAARFGVTKDQLRAAVQAVGDRADKVREYLSGNADKPRGG